MKGYANIDIDSILVGGFEWLLARVLLVAKDKNQDAID